MLGAIAHRGEVSVQGHQPTIALGERRRMLYSYAAAPAEIVRDARSRFIVGDICLGARDALASQLDLRRNGELDDRELILAAYGKWGADCVDHLAGDFAFMIWDAAERRLFAARDVFGVKPFYYARVGDAFIAASEIKALFASGLVPRKLNETRVADYLCGMHEDKEITFFEGIVRLPSAHVLQLESNSLRLRKYWQPDPEREHRFSRDEEYYEGFQEVFIQCVNDRLRTDLPIASTLSGGLDSSSITCVARNALASRGGPELHTYSAVFAKVSECDERKFIDPALRLGGFTPHFQNFDETGPLSHAVDAFRETDQPYYLPNFYVMRAMTQSAAADGCALFLDGADGDSVISHSPYYLTELFREQRWAEYAQLVRGMSRAYNYPIQSVIDVTARESLRAMSSGLRWGNFARAASALSSELGISLGATVFNHGLKPWVPESLKHAYRKVKRRELENEDVIRKDFLDRVGMKERKRRFGLDRKWVVVSEREAHAYRLGVGSIPFVMEMLDHTTSAQGLDAVHPFMDRRLAEYCLAMPGRLKISEEFSRLTLRKGMEGILPPEIQWRNQKSDFTNSFTRGLRELDRSMLESICLNPPAALFEFVEPAMLKRLFERFIAEGKPRQGSLLWRPATLGLWFRTVENESQVVPDIDKAATAVAG